MSSVPDRPLRAAHVASVELDGEVVCLADGVLHMLNHSAAVVWMYCDGVSTVDDICARIADATGHPRAAITSDVVTVVRDFVTRGLCEPG
jgi:hypothetical protein